MKMHRSKTLQLYTSEKDYQPLTLVQLCYTEILANKLKNWEGMQMIDIKKVLHEKSFKLATFCTKYYEIVLLLNPKIVKNIKDYDWPVRIHSKT
jgi:hypothetical protein